MSKEMTRAAAVETVVIKGDLKPLSEDERLSYYRRTCESLGLNPYTGPFGYIEFQGRLRLYALRNCTDQLRKIHHVSVVSVHEDEREGILSVRVQVRDREGREDQDIGCVVVSGLKGEALCNARMKAMTKAKRRATLSLCGLGWLDESELDTLGQVEVPPPPEPKRLPAPDVHVPAPPPKLSKPKTGNELYGRVAQRDIDLTREGLIKAGELVKAVMEFGEQQGLAESWSQWPASAIPLGYQAAVDFEKERRQEKEEQTSM